MEKQVWNVYNSKLERCAL